MNYPWNIPKQKLSELYPEKMAKEKYDEILVFSFPEKNTTFFQKAIYENKKTMQKIHYKYNNNYINNKNFLDEGFIRLGKRKI